MLKVSNDYVHPPICNLFTTNPHDGLYILSHVTADYEKKQFHYACVSAWREVY